LCQRKKVSQLGIIARNIHPKGLRFGPDFDHLDDLPEVEEGAIISATAIRSAYDEPMFGFDGDWSTDSRVCLVARAPRCCTLLAAVISMDTNA
jgi:hypothetical protein